MGRKPCTARLYSQKDMYYHYKFENDKWYYVYSRSECPRADHPYWERFKGSLSFLLQFIEAGTIVEVTCGT